MMRLRCLARQASHGTLCERGAEPAMRHIHIGGSPGRDHDVTWIDEHCAPDAGPDGRKTAALRLLEIAHALDRLAFAQNTSTTQYDFLRAAAARLNAGTRAAASDLDVVTSRIDSAKELVAHAPSVGDSSLAQWARAEIDLLEAAAEILRPWAEGGR